MGSSESKTSSFVALDFETANEQWNSPCQIGLVIVERGKVVERISRLIRPKDNRFRDFNTRLHGIDMARVRNEPQFDEVWHDLRPKLEGCVVLAHNASFDMGVLRRVLDLYDLDYPTMFYGCTAQLSKLTWPNMPNYSLDTVASKLGIHMDRHHDALSDAEVCARIALKIMEHHGVNDLDGLHASCQYQFGQIQPGEYTQARKAKNKKLVESKSGGRDGAAFNANTIKDTPRKRRSRKVPRSGSW
jgi:DNA polymerase III subunit epsilon